MDLPFGDDVNYWKTGKSSPDSWIEKTKRLIEKFDGEVLGEAFGSDASVGRAAFMLSFRLGGDRFDVVWPVLPSRYDEEGAAKRQAATMLHHDVKARLISSEVQGARAAFFSYMKLPDGRRAAQLSDPEMVDLLPKMIQPKRLTDSRGKT